MLSVAPWPPVSYACAGEVLAEVDAAGWVEPQIVVPPPPGICAAAGPSENPAVVTIVRPNQRATVTVTNTFLAFTG